MLNWNLHRGSALFVIAIVMLLLTWPSTLHANGASMFAPANMLPLKCLGGSKEYRLVEANAPGLLYHPGEKVDLTFVFVKSTQSSFTLEIQGVHTRKPNKSTQYIDPYGYPDILNLDGDPIHVPLTVTHTDTAETTVKVTDLPVPQRYGTYCLILINGQERRILGSVARVMRPQPQGTVETTPVFGEGEMLNGFGKFRDQAAMALQRMGIRGVRAEISWKDTNDDPDYDWAQYDELTKSLKAGGVQALFTLGGVDGSKYGIVTKPWSPTPAAVDPDWKGDPYGGKADWGAAPKHFDQYAQWIEAFSKRYWEDGKGALWGFENYNEPWEGGGISGYARDMLVYREWQKRLAIAAHSVSKDIRVCAASSIMNTEDKLYSEGPRADGTFEFDQYIDVFTDHYVPPYGAYGPMVAAAHGKFSIENETWLVINEYLLPQVMCQWLGSGQRCVTPFHPNALYNSLPGSPYRYFNPTTVPVAVAAFNHFVTGHRFTKLVFPEHLPWLFQFGKDEDPTGVCVMFGQLLTRGGPTPQDDPKGRLWGQVDSVDGGTITLDNTDGAMRFYDVAGNELYEKQARVTLPLSILPTYIIAKGGPKQIAQRVRDGVIADKYPAEILPHDFTQTITDPNLKLRVELTNRLNRPITGKLSASGPEGFVVAENGASVTLDAGARKTVELRVTSIKPEATNQYPLQFTFDTDAGTCKYAQVLQSNAVQRGSKTIDGDLRDWANVPGVTLVGQVKGVNADELARRPWLRLVEDLPAEVPTVELKMAWDDQYVYIAAQVKDATPQDDKVRMATRDEQSYFHSATSDEQEPWKSWLAKHAPGQSFAQVPYIYKKRPHDGPFVGDTLLLGFDVLAGLSHHGMVPVTQVPAGFHVLPDTDYEFAAYLCGDGASEMWTLLAPGVPRMHDWPRQPRGPRTTGVTPGAKHVVKQNGLVRVYELAIPRQTMPELSLKAGSSFGFTFFVGNNRGAKIAYGQDKAVTKSNALTLHPYWESTPSCAVIWTLVE